MKTFISTFLLFFLIINAGAQKNEFTLQKDYQTDKKKIFDAINAIKKVNQDSKHSIALQNHSMDSLKMLLSNFKLQIDKSNDSIVKVSSSMLDLKTRFENQRSMSKTTLVITFTIIFLLILLILLLFLSYKKKLNETMLQLTALDEKTKTRLDELLLLVRNELKECNDNLNTKTSALSNRIETGLDKSRVRIDQIDQQLKQNGESIEDQLSKIKGENQVIVKKQEEKLIDLNKTFDEKTIGLSQGLITTNEKIKEIIATFTREIDKLKK